jgi:2-keto-4-pentenoate hydratase/2-oxohepta-3-ene-1,7-dioic acid hydratase in catechol pathway
LKLVTYDIGDRRVGGVLSSDGTRVAALSDLSGGTLASVLDLIAAGPAASAMVAEAVRTGRGEWMPITAVTIGAPIPAPKRNIFCVGKNYYEHAKEFHNSGFDASAGKDAIPEHPIFFTKSSTTIVGPGVPVVASADWTNSVDYEVELAVVIGTGGRGITKADALDHVFGYTIVNDVTSRTLQHQHKQWFLGKNFDTFCPMGPALVTADEIGDVTELEVSTHLNGELRQKAVVKDLIFDVPTLIATLSAVMTLEPGDIIATGTPAGVGIGFNPPRFMKPGDRVTVAITRIGELENPVS